MKVGKAKLNVKGFRQLRTSPGAHRLVEDALGKIATRASQLSGQRYVADVSTSSPNRARGVVRPDTAAAAQDSAANLTPLRALDAGRDVL